MDWRENYKQWVSYPTLELSLREQLQELSKEPNQLEDCFYKKLAFGTAGIRGELGPGPNRMNIYTVRKATEGLAHYINSQGEEAKSRGVVVAYDSRHQSPEFALEVGRVLVGHGIQTYVFEGLRTTPELSFAVRYLHAFSGIVITASHNSKEYNGYKVYDSDGCQVSLEDAETIINYVDAIKQELEIPVLSIEDLEQSSFYQVIGEMLDEAYLKQVEKLVVQPNLIKSMSDEIKIVFSPLHGTGRRPVREVLKRVGFKHVHIVQEQEQPDPNFSTVTYPNPEEAAAFELAIRDGEELDADLLMATDPDADRVGVAVRNEVGIYTVLSGNQIGALILNYLLMQKSVSNTLDPQAKVFKSIVTSELGRVIAADYEIETIDVLTGFKFIGEKITELEISGTGSFLFGYEESYGYLISDFVRDKDAVQACLLIAEVTAYYKSRSLTLFEGLEEIYNKYGYYYEALESVTLKGKEGLTEIESIMMRFRKDIFTKLGSKEVKTIEDYEQGIRIDLQTGNQEKINLPQTNVIKYLFTDGAWICVRPSGTEPKIKFYYGVCEASHELAEQALLELQKALGQYLEK